MPGRGGFQPIQHRGLRAKLATTFFIRSSSSTAFAGCSTRWRSVQILVVAGRDHQAYSHQRIRPSRTQKWDLHPDFRQTDGWSDGRPASLTLMSQRGRASLRIMSSIVSPHPQGHRMPTLQSSPSSRVKTRSRAGNSDGSVSPSRICRWRAGPYLPHRRRNQRVIFMLQPFLACETAAARAAARRLHDQAARSRPGQSRPPRNDPHRRPRG